MFYDAWILQVWFDFNLLDNIMAPEGENIFITLIINTNYVSVIRECTEECLCENKHYNNLKAFTCCFKQWNTLF